MSKLIHLGFEVGTGSEVEIPLGHLAVTGQTQMSGKTTTLEALISRSGLRAVAFVTKRAERGFSQHQTAGIVFRYIQPYFHSRADWQFVSDILESKLHEKLKFQRSWIMKVCRDTHSLEEVQRKVRKELATARRGLDQSVYTELDAYLDLVIPELKRLPYTEKLVLLPGLNVMDLSGYSTSLQMLVISSVLEHVYKHESGVVSIIPEAWEFVPQKRGSPVMRAAEELIRKAAAAGNYVWLDSQDIAGVHKDILKHCSVWILGVQREENEVKRTLDNLYGVGKNKPKANDIRALGKGEFYACWGREMKHVYVQPAWMWRLDAKSIACRDITVESVAKPPAPKPNGKAQEDDDAMWKEKVDELTEQVAALQDENAELRRELEAARGFVAAAGKAVEETVAGGRMAIASRQVPLEQVPINLDVVVGLVIDRIRRDPVLVRLAVERPVVEVTVNRRIMTMDDTTIKGKLAKLLHEGWFAQERNSSEVHREIVRRGIAPKTPAARSWEALNEFCSLGLLYRNEKLYTAAPDVETRIA